MKKTILFIACVSLCLSAGAWGRRNHATVAYIAEKHLTPEAYAKVTEILGGESMMYYASWLDDFRSIELLPDGEGFRHTFYVDKEFEPLMEDIHTSAVLVMEQAVGKLKDYRNLDDSTRLACIKQIVHLMGDIHCPTHVRYADKKDKRIGRFNVLDPGKKEVRYHTYWDSVMTEKMFPGGYLDLAYLCDPLLRSYHSQEAEAYMAKVQEGDLRSWAKDTAKDTRWVYDVCPGEGAQISIPDQQRFAALAKDQILRAGYRLAKVLNDLFTEEK